MRWGRRSLTTRSRSVGSPPSPAPSPNTWTGCRVPRGPASPSFLLLPRRAAAPECSAAHSARFRGLRTHAPALAGRQPCAPLLQAGRRARGRAVTGTGRGLPPPLLPQSRPRKGPCVLQSHVASVWPGGPPPRGDLGGVGANSGPSSQVQGVCGGWANPLRVSPAPEGQGCMEVSGPSPPHSLQGSAGTWVLPGGSRGQNARPG